MKRLHARLAAAMLLAAPTIALADSLEDFFHALSTCSEDRLFTQQSSFPWETREHGFAVVYNIQAKAENPLVYINGELVGQLNNYSPFVGYHPVDLACGGAPPAWLDEHDLEYEDAWVLRLADVYDSRESVGWIWIETATFTSGFEAEEER